MIKYLKKLKTKGCSSAVILSDHELMFNQIPSSISSNRNITYRFLITDGKLTVKAIFPKYMEGALRKFYGW